MNIKKRLPSLNRVVLYADMLGFTALVEKYPIDLHRLMVSERPLSWTLDDMLKKPKNQLTEAFSNFHKALKWTILMAKMRHPLTIISFSDSVFIATYYLFEAVTVAIELLHSLLSMKVPVRIGIAYGSFATLRFKSDIAPDCSDHESQFLGTAVVRAHLTESCGIKGIRILLHPSVIPLLKKTMHNPASQSVDLQPIRYLQCSKSECTNKAGVQYEIDYWHIPKMKEENAWKSLQDMWTAAPEPESIHYQASAEAIDRMRISQGEQPIKNLRRRTLPHHL